MIREVAEVQCGSAKPLDSAVQRGVVVCRANASGVELFYFPSSEWGASETQKHELVAHRDKDIAGRAKKT